jgi:HAD superfamily 5'-nucleotidase-like hydrolase
MELRNLVYLPHFPIRGLHLDKRKGWLMKIDSYHNIQMSSVYYGMNQVDKEDIIKFYGGVRLNIDDIGYTQSSSTLHQFVDLFCLPEISLLASTMQYFLDKNIHFNPEYIFMDVNAAINTLHRNQILHKNIVQSIDDYLLPISNSESSSSLFVKEFLERLNKSGKNTFLITNSPYWFVNFGMQSLLGSDWTNLFDLIICSARKPHFFQAKSKPFRQFNMSTNSKSWEKVTQFKKNEVYYEGNLFEMLEKTGWHRNSVLYFGDHIYGDLGN